MTLGYFAAKFRGSLHIAVDKRTSVHNVVSTWKSLDVRSDHVVVAEDVSQVRDQFHSNLLTEPCIWNYP